MINVRRQRGDCLCIHHRCWAAQGDYNNNNIFIQSSYLSMNIITKQLHEDIVLRLWCAQRWWWRRHDDNVTMTTHAVSGIAYLWEGWRWRLELSYLDAKKYDGYHSKPGMERVEIGDATLVVILEGGIYSHHTEQESYPVHGSVDYFLDLFGSW